MIRFATISGGKSPLPRIGFQLGEKVLDLAGYDSSSITNYIKPSSNVEELIKSTRSKLNNKIENRKFYEEFESGTLFHLVENFNDNDLEFFQKLAKNSSTISANSDIILPTNSLKFHAPFTSPRRNVLCVGKNYLDHIAEVAAADKSNKITSTPASDALPKYPQFFTKNTKAVVGHLTDVESHSSLTKWYDYEAELAVVIGKEGRNLTKENALSHVFGYTLANDMTSRDVQKRHNQWFKGKSLDGSCPLGPFITHKSSILEDGTSLNPQNLGIKMFINQEQRQSSNTSNMIFKIEDLLVELSNCMTLLPGDILLTGTPNGVGYAMNPPQVLKRGDNMVVEIQHLGRLENNVI